MFAPKSINAPFPPEEIVAFYRRTGYHVVQSDSCWWYNEYSQKRMYFAFPLHRLVTPSRQEMDSLFSAVPEAWGFRFITPSNAKGKESFIWTCRGPYDLTSLNRNRRNQVRRGMERCQIRTLPFKEIVRLGWESHRDTLRRHGEEATSLGFDVDLEGCPAYEAWGAFVDDHLAAFIVTFWVEDWAYILINRSADAYRNSYPNSALYFVVVQELLARPGISTVTSGWESLAPLKSLEDFKMSMGFTRQPVRQQIILRLWMRHLFNPIVCKAIAKLASFRRGNYRLQRITGFCQVLAES